MPEWLHQNTGDSRRDRRHFVTHTGKKVNIPKEFQVPPTNEPYRVDTSDQGQTD
jgi:hypothetical protein